MMPPAQSPWPEGARAAVSLTYDGARDAHLGFVAEDLAHYGLRGTFFLDVARALDRMPQWRQAFERGHEIGNGCLFEAADPDGALGRWTREMVFAEIEAAREFLDEQFPALDRSFAFPFGSPRCAAGADYRDVVEASGYVARSGIEGFNAPSSCALSYLRMIPAAGLSAEEVVTLAQIGVRASAWLIFAFGDFGEGSELCCARAHRELTRWLWQTGADVWIAPMAPVARTLRSCRVLVH